MIKIGIIGFGVVGKAAANTLSKNFDLVIYDKFHSHDDFGDLNTCKFVFIAVPTPFDCKTNRIDDSAVIESLKNLEKIGYSEIVIIKSTVPPGSCKKYLSKFNFRMVFNPEFLRESTTPNEDFKNQEIIVVGAEDSHDFDAVKGMYQTFSVSNAEYYHTSLEEAEMIKCAQNTMLASRVALANMVYDACQSYGLEYAKIRKIAFDSFDVLGPHMVQVPGPDGKRGFGGKCLPKDSRAFLSVHESDLLKEIIRYNESLRDDFDKSLINYKK